MAIKNILLIQPVFAPDERQAERNKNSIKSLGEYLKTHGTDGINLSIIMGGWAKTDELWNDIVQNGKKYFNDSFAPIRFDKNYGKAYVVNNLYRTVITQNNNIQALISADSDIIFPLDTPHLFTRLSVASEQMVKVKKQPWGLIGLNQLQHGCHFKSCYENQVEYKINIRDKDYSEKIVWPSIPSGIAGGCLFINREYWDKVGGYDQNRAKIYGPDDAFLLSYCGNTGYSWQMSDSIGIIHPFDNDQQYAEWKVRVCQRVARNPQEKYEDTLNEAETFWKNR